MLTIGRKFRGELRDFPAMCDYCGTPWLRSELTEDMAGLLYCPQEGDGADLVELSEDIARSASDFRGPGNNDDGGVPMSKANEIAPDIADSIGGENPR